MASRKDSSIAEVESIISAILDPQELEIFAIRQKGCKIVYANARAKARIHLYNDDDACTDLSSSCETSYARHFPGLCKHCPYGENSEDWESKSFEIEDAEGRAYKARFNTINWIDGKPATILTLYDITEEISSKNRLHALAYKDHLTGIPNRQQLKEDFAAMREDIANNMLSGVIALFDLDNFKAVNDTYGHNTGDLVLRRLAEHLQDDEIFSGHLYRLGGDEFVIMFSDFSDKFGSDEEMRVYYEGLLTNALRAYTLPNIETKCTLSMGVSLFPSQGDGLSEVLRKADIALYRAKETGRNKIVFFDSQYDSAQKFKDLYINLQPILRVDGRTFAYELIDRGNSEEGDDRTVSLDGFNRTVDALGLHNIESDKQYFLSYSEQLLNPIVLKDLPKDKFVVQVQLQKVISKESLRLELENVQRICIELRKKGYKLALVNFHSGIQADEILKIVDYCKFDSADRNKMRQQRLIANYNNVRFIATNVDTPELFRSAQDMGYKLFQGFHFNQPVLGKMTKEISPLKANYYRLLKLSSIDASADEYMNFKEISSIISADVALSYKLLRMLNSPAVGLRKVSSISVGVAYLGEENLKKWISVLALRGVADEKPLELVRMSLIRARFGELLAPQFRNKRNPEQVFMVSMLSLLHIALDLTKEQLLEEILIDSDISDSLLTKTGKYSDLLRFYENYEYANWDAVAQYVEDNQLDPEFVTDAYISATKWYTSLMVE